MIDVRDGSTSDPDDAHGQMSIADWERRLQAMPGFRAFVWQRQVHRVAYVFQTNLAEYRHFIDTLQWQGRRPPTRDVANADVLDQVLDESQRLLHNVLAAMATRVAQLRRFVRHNFDAGSPIAIEYDERVAALFASDVTAAFLQKMRNELAHAQLPIVSSTETIRAGSTTVAIVLPCDALLDWTDRNSKITTWLARHPGGVVDIGEVLDGYARRAGNLDDWLQQRIGIEYRGEIDQFAAAEDAFFRSRGL
ncbi:hypothetical protein [Amycolatopsis sp. NBC_01480]|uniref:hypothetical protein n=1 Tax=Amycolatopsis sp. NBC_01480 TaxID=2903562 RepID=UPI002E2987CC|nr:hypothetical protein [Amycolatopsis sp. NBC_01480]